MMMNLLFSAILHSFYQPILIRILNVSLFWTSTRDAMKRRERAISRVKWNEFLMAKLVPEPKPGTMSDTHLFRR